MVDRTDLGSVGASHESSSLSPPTVRRLARVSGALLTEEQVRLHYSITIVVGSVFVLPGRNALRSYFITQVLEEK